MVRYRKGHKNSKGEKAEWCIVSHKTGRIISSHKSKSAAEKHLGEIQMFKHMKNESMSLNEAKQILKNAGYYLEEQVNRHPLKSEHFINYLKKLLDNYGFHEREKNTDPEPMTYLYTYDMNVTMFEISEKGEYDDEIMVNILFSGISSDGSVYTIVANNTSYDGDNIEDFKADLDQVFGVK